MKKRLLAGTVVALLAAGLFLSVLCYNYWSYGCGRCTVGTFLTIGPFGALLLALILGAVLVLTVLRRRRHRALDSRCCPCGAPLTNDWNYCPACGVPRST